MSATVHIMRGVPGSGKSTRAKELTSPEFICSADDYFISKETGGYVFVPHEIGKAHQACLKKFVDLLHKYTIAEGHICGPEGLHVVVDNTNLRRWEYETYVKIAELSAWDVEFHEFVPPRDNTLGDYVRNCASRNVHSVSPNAVLRMASIFEVRQ
jgi:predicted kinase